MSIVVDHVEYRKPTPEQLEMLKQIELDKGGHEKPDYKPHFEEDTDTKWGGDIEVGVCVMEAIAFITGQEHTAQPMCVSPAIVSFAIPTNDQAGDVNRQKLKKIIPELMGTAPVEHITQTYHRGGKLFTKQSQKQGSIYKYKQFREAENKRQEMIDRAGRHLSFEQEIALLRRMAAISIVPEGENA